ncbi:hypothetical protein C8Q80DRAFT_407239 [Daedaleopsis nitida]|nr:hypothetical protein C8Q80DRAFT_407239 [Daedaleopsis nitida]
MASRNANFLFLPMPGYAAHGFMLRILSSRTLHFFHTSSDLLPLAVKGSSRKNPRQNTSHQAMDSRLNQADALDNYWCRAVAASPGRCKPERTATRRAGCANVVLTPTSWGARTGHRTAGAVGRRNECGLILINVGGVNTHRDRQDDELPVRGSWTGVGRCRWWMRAGSERISRSWLTFLSRYSFGRRRPTAEDSPEYDTAKVQNEISDGDLGRIRTADTDNPAEYNRQEYAQHSYVNCHRYRTMELR